MREVTRQMIEKYALMKLKYDFMGYEFQNPNQLSFHHLLVPRKLCKKQGLENGFYEWNGAILRRDTSHDYLHIIEQYDYDRFLAITSELLDENIKGHLSIENLKEIDDIIYGFEREYLGKLNDKGHPIILPKYLERIKTEGKRY